MTLVINALNCEYLRGFVEKNEIVATRNNVHTRAVRLRAKTDLFSKIIGAF
jgi:hypothetical protein